ncbi:hypothetical protein [Paucibacter sp. Y2R2-4]|uniref:hypothetical protein n=1 Tax=Paucibacter sp. Y2R2-4 TaxID=2893553 RepID=UPI0021E48721|nr:hypothetical protein [Paucibacter sp. Y2R2-4]MCV2350413.1 hypothetical protein [Paucibacter sp. Y2R2-4]
MIRILQIDACFRKRLLGSALGLSFSLALTACGGGSSEDPAQASRITAENMVEVAALSEFENWQSGYVSAAMFLQNEFSNGANGAGTKKCSTSGSVAYKQSDVEFSLTPDACKHSFSGRELVLTSGDMQMGRQANAGEESAFADYKNWKSSYNFLSDVGLMGADAPVLNGGSVFRTSSSGVYEQISTYRLNRDSLFFSRESLYIDVHRNLRHDQKFVAQGGLEQSFIEIQSSVSNINFAQALKIRRTTVLSRPVGAAPGNETASEQPVVVSAVDGSELTITREGAELRLSLRNKEGPLASKTIQQAELDAALKKLL